MISFFVEVHAEVEGRVVYGQCPTKKENTWCVLLTRKQNSLHLFAELSKPSVTKHDLRIGDFASSPPNGSERLSGTFKQSKVVFSDSNQRPDAISQSQDAIWVPVETLIKVASEGQNLIQDASGLDRILDSKTIEVLGDPSVQEGFRRILSSPFPRDVLLKGKINLELKKRHQLRQAKLKSINGLNEESKPLITQSEFDLKGSDQPLEQRLERMIKAYNTQIEVDKKDERDTLSLVDTYASQQIRKMVDRERELLPYYVFYHALPNDVAFAYDVLTEFKRQLDIHPLQNAKVLRNFSNVLSQFSNAAEVKSKLLAKKSGFADDKDINYRKIALSANISLFQNRNVYSEDSLYRWVKGYSDQSIQEGGELGPKIIIQLLQSIGVGASKARKYYDLYRKNYGGVASQLGKGKGLARMLQIFISPNKIDQVVYPSRSGGHEVPGVDDMKVVLDAIRSGKPLDEKLNGIFYWMAFQARIFLDPEVFNGSDDVKIFEYFNTPITFTSSTESPEVESEETFQKNLDELKNLVSFDLEKLLGERKTVVKAGVQPPILKLNNLIHGSVRSTEEITPDEIVNWIDKKETDRVIQYYDQHPDALHLKLDVQPPIHFYKNGFASSKMTKSYQFETFNHPIQIALMYRNEKLTNYFAEKMSSEEVKRAFSQNLIYGDHKDYTKLKVVHPLAIAGFYFKDPVKLFETLRKKGLSSSVPPDPRLEEVNSGSPYKNWLPLMMAWADKKEKHPLVRWLLINDLEFLRLYLMNGMLRHEIPTAKNMPNLFSSINQKLPKSVFYSDVNYDLVRDMWESLKYLFTQSKQKAHSECCSPSSKLLDLSLVNFDEVLSGYVDQKMPGGIPTDAVDDILHFVAPYFRREEMRYLVQYVGKRLTAESKWGLTKDQTSILESILMKKIEHAFQLIDPPRPTIEPECGSYGSCSIQ